MNNSHFSGAAHRRSDDEMQYLLDPSQNNHFGYFEQIIPVRIHSFFLNRAIEDPQHYTEMVHKIRNAPSHDVIYIHLATPGGQLTTGMQIINAIRTTDAKVVTVLDGEACSLGTFIFLSGHEQEVHDDAVMMFHDMSFGAYGKANEHALRTDSLRKWYQKMCKRICSGFLTTQEIDAICNGQDLWMESDEVRKRLKRMHDERDQPKPAPLPARKARKAPKVATPVAEPSSDGSSEG